VTKDGTENENAAKDGLCTPSNSLASQIIMFPNNRLRVIGPILHIGANASREPAPVVIFSIDKSLDE
jgi:hypothetical protein